MPPPHHHDHHHHHHHHHEEMEAYDDYDFEELPYHLKEAAKILGYNQKIWDEDGLADTEEMGWHDLSHEQRKAAEEFGYHPKLWDEGHGHRHLPPHHHEMEDYDDYDWHELPPHLKDAAGVLGWNEKLWDTDGEADTEAIKWKELSPKQKRAAEQFGYHPKLWDEGKGLRHPPPPAHHKDHEHGPPKEDDEKKDEDVDVDVSNLNVNDVEEAYEDDKKEESQKQENKKKMFKMSKTFGGDGGNKFDHGNNRHISKISVYTDGHVVKGLEVGYANTTKKSGKCGGKATTFELERGEFITSATVRSNKYVQSIGFKTNKGNMLGPVGGKGWTKIDLRGNDTEGEEVKVPAPFKYQLCGFTGRSGDHVDQIAFRWGPVPQPAKKN